MKKDRSVSAMPLILRQAQDFLLAHQILKDHKWSKSKTENEAVFFADVVNLSFAIELFLKALLSKDNISSHGHNLKNLFNKLPPKMQKEIEGAFNKHRLKNEGKFNDILGISFKQRLLQHSELFQSWRYYYEEIRPSFHSEFFDVLAVVLNNLTQAYCAEWIETSGR